MSVLPYYAGTGPPDIRFRDLYPPALLAASRADSSRVNKKRVGRFVARLELSGRGKMNVHALVPRSVPRRKSISGAYPLPVGVALGVRVIVALEIAAHMMTVKPHAFLRAELGRVSAVWVHLKLTAAVCANECNSHVNHLC